MNMEFGTQIDDEYTYKLCKKRNYCLKSGIKKYIFFGWNFEILYDR